MRNYQTILLIYFQLIWIRGITMYAIVCSTIFTEFIRNTSKMAEYCLDTFSKFWSGLYKVKVKVKQSVSGMFAPPQEIF
jgi:hypothetical protein